MYGKGKEYELTLTGEEMQRLCYVVYTYLTYSLDDTHWKKHAESWTKEFREQMSMASQLHEIAGKGSWWLEYAEPKIKEKLNMQRKVES